MFKIIISHNFYVRKIHTFISALLAAKNLDINDVIVLLPTPPLPDNTNSLFLTVESLSLTRSIVGSGCLVIPDAHITWFGQPAHIDTFPASLFAVPGQSIKMLLLIHYIINKVLLICYIHTRCIIHTRCMNYYIQFL